MPSLDLSRVHAAIVDGAFKGFPATHPPLPIKDIAQQHWNVLREDAPFPVAVLKDSALRHNSSNMRRYVEANGAVLCPHGKATMSPQLFERQLSDGAWGLTAATTTHVNVYRQLGVRRIFYANQLIGHENVASIVNELRTDPYLEFYCLLDSPRHADLLADRLRVNAATRPVNVLVEVGAPGGRCGVRSLQQGIELAHHAAALDDVFKVTGIEAFEGVFAIGGDDSTKRVERMLQTVVELAEYCDAQRLLRGSELILTAGGSLYFDRVIRAFGRARLSRRATIVLRSGCYLIHDHKFYQDENHREQVRAGPTYPRFQPALEVWTCVQSVPEPGLAILALGKRDISHDIHMPQPLYRARSQAVEHLASDRFEVTTLSDQHAFMRTPIGSEPQVGDLIGLGVSHPCTTFDKWQLLYVVDDDYNVLEGVRTYF